LASQQQKYKELDIEMKKANSRNKMQENQSRKVWVDTRAITGNPNSALLARHRQEE